MTSRVARRRPGWSGSRPCQRPPARRSGPWIDVAGICSTPGCCSPAAPPRRTARHPLGQRGRALDDRPRMSDVRSSRPGAESRRHVRQWRVEQPRVPGCPQALSSPAERLVTVPDGDAVIAIAGRPDADQFLAVLMHQHAEAAGERVGIVCLQSATAVQRVVDQVVEVLGWSSPWSSRGPPEVDDRARLREHAGAHPRSSSSGSRFVRTETWARLHQQRRAWNGSSSVPVLYRSKLAAGVQRRSETWRAGSRPA